jgi:hypothetical protein
MSRILPRLFCMTLFMALVFPLCAVAEETGLLDKEEEEAVTFDPDSVEEDDFDTNVNPVHESALQGFDCMDNDGDGYLTMEELERRGECVEDAQARGMDSETRTALILTRMDADRDRKVSRREFNIWNEMQTQQE